MAAKKHARSNSVKKTKASSKNKSSFWRRISERISQKTRQYLARRPHRSFRKTERRDYFRSLVLPGYWSFTHYIWQTLWKNKQLFIWVVVVYGLFTATFIGIASEDTYNTLNDALQETGDEIFQGNWGEIGKASLLLLSGVTGSFNATPTEAQQAYGLFFGIMTWLTSVWLLRSVLAGQKPRFRDGLYNSGAAIIPTMLIFLVLVIQLVPAAIATIVGTTAISTGALEGAIAMVFAAASLLLYVLSLYWTVSTLIALVIVTLPGMYPMQALKTAGDLVIGRRLRILYRWLWLGGVIAVAWVVILVPVILLDAWLKSAIPAISWVPIVPVGLLIMSSFTIVFSAAYVYLLYRKVVEDGAKPA